MIRESIDTLVSGCALTFEQAAGVMEEIMSGDATPAQIAAFITALRVKGETVDEIAGLASIMRAKAIPVKVTPPVVDTCGTGGDNSSTFNISTAAAFVVAGAGLKVAKHGNRAITSHCGSADVLEALGVKIDLGAEAVAKCLETVGIGFMFAPIFHPAMKYAAVPRREIGIRTVFNILGPLTNPARAESQVIGVPNQDIGNKIASVLHRLGTKHSLVVHGIDGENAEMLRGILGGEKGARRDIVVLNAAAALLAGNQAPDFKQGIRLAQEAIDSGRALEKLDRLVELSQSLG
jgi:anthranilate phosphoribosyltransferase